MKSILREKIYKNIEIHLSDGKYRGAALDQAFVAAGFVGVEAEIELLNGVFGKNSYAAFIDSVSSDQGREASIERSAAIRNEILAARGDSKNESLVVSKLIANESISGYAKYEILKRFYPELVAILFSEKLPDFYRRKSQEVEIICKLFREPCFSLLEKSMSSKRKQIYNEVVIDAFSVMGFSAVGNIRGLVVMERKLDRKFSVRIAADAGDFGKSYALLGKPDVSVYWHQIPVSMCTSIISEPDSASDFQVPLGVSINSVAASRMMKYDCSCSLEVAIRAHAFFYKYAFSPYEKSFIA